MEDENVENEDLESAITGACKKCNCPSWRGDSGEPEKCLNIDQPSTRVCGHEKHEHS